MTERILLTRCRRAGRTYGSGATVAVALQPTDCEVAPGARVAIVGPSGSGKSTLLHLLAGLDRPTVGTVDWPAIGPPEVLRPGPVAVVFQGPSLLPPLTVQENVALPLLLAGSTHADAQRGAAGALELVGLSAERDRLPEEISGGQAQRAGVARALAGRPALILADEPTGQLDHASAEGVIDVLLAGADRTGAALVIATHDLTIADRLAERWTMRNGRLDGASTEVPA